MYNYNHCFFYYKKVIDIFIWILYYIIIEKYKWQKKECDELSKKLLNFNSLDGLTVIIYLSYKTLILNDIQLID
jgi:hypothetical protein